MDISLSCFESLGSTSVYAQKLLSEGKRVPFAVQANEQTDGLGQRGKSWTSPKGNLYVSIVIPNTPKELKARGLIPLKAACLVSKWILSELGVQTTIKWPNDLYFAGQKLAGILCQSSVKSYTWGDLLIGIGVNVNLAPELPVGGYQSISLAQIFAKSFDVNGLAQSLVTFLGQDWFAYDELSVRKLYQGFCLSPFSLWRDEQEKPAKVYQEVGIDCDGSLCLQQLFDPSLESKLPDLKKLSSARHSFLNVFLGGEDFPAVVTCKLQGQLFIAIFSSRRSPKPYRLIRFMQERSFHELDIALNEVKSCLGILMPRFAGNSWPVASCAEVFRDQPTLEKFASIGLKLSKAPMKARLSKGFNNIQSPDGLLRLAAIESWLEKTRPSKSAHSKKVMFDWTGTFGLKDFLGSDGRYLGFIRAKEGVLPLSEQGAIECVRPAELAHLVLHGLMLLVLG